MHGGRDLAGRRLRAVGAVAALAAAGVVVPLLVAGHFGALGIPRGDDWSYLLTEFRFVDHGELRFNNWVSMTLVGQLVLAAPVVLLGGRDITALQVFTVVLGLGGLLAVAELGRRLVSPAAGVLVAVTVALGPLWGPLSVSFMTDVPAFAVTAVAALVGVDALRRRPVPLARVAAAMALGLLAFTIRQYAIVVVVALAMATAGALTARADRRRLLTLAALTAGAIALAALFLVWWYGIPEAKPFEPAFGRGHGFATFVGKGAGFLRLTGLLLAPVLVAAGPLRLVRRAWEQSRAVSLVAGGGAGAWMVAASWRLPRGPFVGNYISLDGALSRDVLLGQRPDLLPGPLLDLLVVAATVLAVLTVLAAVPAAVAIGRRLGARDLTGYDPAIAFLGLTVAGYALAYAAAALGDVPVYDRYALPALPIIGILVLRGTREVRTTARAGTPARAGGTRVATGVALAALAALGLAYTVDSASFDGTRWSVAQAAVRAGYPADRVNGGFEWINYHRGKKITRGPGRSISDRVPERGAERPSAGPPSPRRLPFCVKVSVGPRRPEPGPRVIAVREYRALGRRVAYVSAVRNNVPCPEVKARPGRTG